MRRAVILVMILTGIVQADSEIHVVITGMGAAGPYRLGYTHIIINSEKVEYKEQLLISENDYRINYNDGLITLTSPLAIGDTLNITFSILPLNLKPSYQNMKPIAATEKDIVNITPIIKSVKLHDQLDIIGSKGFAVNIGSRGDPTLSQSLDLDISGQLAGDVYVKGSITDQNFGTSSGGTRSLDELDKIFLSVETKGFKGDFGDIELKGVNNSLLDFRRKLTGLSASGSVGDFTGASAIAFSPGKQVELFFYGVDGKQGPYLLQSPDLSLSISGESAFLPGTEEIYLDGRKLKRGVENDYNIDYYDGYIEFMPKNIISSKSRITVKIQYASEGYRRGFYNVNTIWDNAVSIGFQYLGEKDDKSSPRSFDMGEVEREVIDRAGADRDSAYSSGAKYVGAGNGDYILETDTLNRDYYAYVGSDSGDYDVSFSRVASGYGDYRYAGSGVYVYVGAGNGSYLPKIYYPLPENKDYGSIILKREGDFYFGCELAASRDDRNMLSKRDEPLVGTGLLGDIGLKKKELTFWNRQWNADIFNLKLRSLDERFVTPGIIDPPEFFRRYNIPQSHLNANDRLVEIQTRAISSSGDNINVGGGIFRSDDFDAQRGFGRFSFVTFDWVKLSAMTEISRSEDKVTGFSSNWNKYESGIGIIKGVIQPGVIYRHELNNGLNSLSTDGFKADEYEGNLNAYLTSKLTSKSKLLYRDQKSGNQESMTSNEWADQYHQYQIEQGVVYGDHSKGFNGEVNLSRLYQTRFLPQDETIARNMGDLKVNYNVDNFNLTFYESINGTSRLARAREYIFVGDGRGNFRKDGDDYIPEPGGDYIEVIRQLGETELSGYEISGGFRGRVAGKVFSKQGILSKINYENELTHKTYLTAATDLQAKYLVPLYQFNDDETTFRTYEYNQRTTFRLNRSGDYIRHTLKTSRSQGADFQFENLDSRSLTNIADFKILSGKGISYSISTEYSTENKQLYSGSVDLERLKIQLVPEFHPIMILRIEMPLEFSNEDEKIRDVTVLSYSAGVKSIINFRRAGRIEIEGGYTRVDTDREDIFLPYVLAAGRKQGDNFNGLISARFKLNSYSHVELQFNYKKLGDGYSISNLRLEAKAQF